MFFYFLDATHPKFDFISEHTDDRQAMAIVCVLRIKKFHHKPGVRVKCINISVTVVKLFGEV